MYMLNVITDGKRLIAARFGIPESELRIGYCRGSYKFYFNRFQRRTDYNIEVPTGLFLYDIEQEGLNKVKQI